MTPAKAPPRRTDGAGRDKATCSATVNLVQAGAAPLPSDLPVA